MVPLKIAIYLQSHVDTRVVGHLKAGVDRLEKQGAQHHSVGGLSFGRQLLHVDSAILSCLTIGCEREQGNTNVEVVSAGSKLNPETEVVEQVPVLVAWLN